MEANIILAKSKATGVLNIARGKRISINHVAKLIIGLVGSNIKLIHEGPRPGDIKHSLADTSRARTFGYDPKYSLEEGLGKTLSSFQHEI